MLIRIMILALVKSFGRSTDKRTDENYYIANYKHRINIDIAKCMITKYLINGKNNITQEWEFSSRLHIALGREGKKTTDLTVCKAVKLLRIYFFSPTQLLSDISSQLLYFFSLFLQE